MNLGRIQEYIDMGRLPVPPAGQMLTMRDLLASGVVNRVKQGIKLLAKVLTKLLGL